MYQCAMMESAYELATEWRIPSLFDFSGNNSPCNRVTISQQNFHNLYSYIQRSVSGKFCISLLQIAVLELSKFNKVCPQSTALCFSFHSGPLSSWISGVDSIILSEASSRIWNLPCPCLLSTKAALLTHCPSHEHTSPYPPPLVILLIILNYLIKSISQCPDLATLFHSIFNDFFFIITFFHTLDHPGCFLYLF